MRVSGAFAVVHLLAARLSFASAGSSSTTGDECTKLVVSAEDYADGAYSGDFYQVGLSAELYPLYKSLPRGLILIYSPSDGNDSFAEVTTKVITSVEPDDGLLDVELNTSVDERRSLQISSSCGYWVLGAEGEGDTAEYPVLKVFDCTNDLISVAIASDSDWELQNCTECESTVDGVGEVTITAEASENSDCEAAETATLPPSTTPAPSMAPMDSPTLVPMDAMTDDESDPAIVVEQGGAGRAAIGAGMEIGVAVLAVAGMAAISRKM